jgi:hypothetical protein
MRVRELPFCFVCPARQVREAPAAAATEPFHQVVNCLRGFVDYRDDFIATCTELDADLRATLGEGYKTSGNFCDADEDFVHTAYDAKAQILACLDNPPADITEETARGIGHCAQMLAAGECRHTEAIPHYADKLAEMQAKRQVE